MELLPTRDVIKRLGVSSSTLSRWVASGRITPTLRGEGIRGGMWFWPRDVETLARELGVDQGTEAASA